MINNELRDKLFRETEAKDTFAFVVFCFLSIGAIIGLAFLGGWFFTASAIPLWVRIGVPSAIVGIVILAILVWFVIYTTFNR